jgi:hypothetical protein
LGKESGLLYESDSKAGAKTMMGIGHTSCVLA